MLAGKWAWLSFTIAGLTALATFAAVNLIAFLQCRKHRWIFAFGSAGAGIFAVVLVGRLIVEAPVALGLLTVVVLIATFGRPRINRWSQSLHEKSDTVWDDEIS
jgi:hypothetical protein